MQTLELFVFTCVYGVVKFLSQKWNPYLVLVAVWNKLWTLQKSILQFSVWWQCEWNGQSSQGDKKLYWRPCVLTHLLFEFLFRYPLWPCLDMIYTTRINNPYKVTTFLWQEHNSCSMNNIPVTGTNSCWRKKISFKIKKILVTRTKFLLQ